MRRKAPCGIGAPSRPSGYNRRTASLRLTAALVRRDVLTAVVWRRWTDGEAAGSLLACCSMAPTARTGGALFRVKRSYR